MNGAQERVLDQDARVTMKSAGSLTFVRAVAYGGLLVGVLDGLAAVIGFALRGRPPIRVFQAIASGLLGPASFQGGMASAILGLGIHFFIASAITGSYVGASLQWPMLRRRPWLFGPAYGVAAYLVMSLIVMPLSAIGWRGWSALSLEGVLIHVFLVGLPIALIATRIAPRASGR